MSCPGEASGDGNRYMPSLSSLDGIDAGYLIANARLVDRDRDTPGAIFVRNGKIAAVYTGEEADRIRDELENASVDCGEPFYPGPPEVVDAYGATLMPAFVDLHAHFRDPGFTQKEDIASASAAASAGGYGTVVLMANTNPVISTQGDALAVNERVRTCGLVESFQAVSLTRNFDGRDTSALSDLDPALVPVATEDGREVASAAVMLNAMKRCAISGVIVSCHCEDPELALAAKPLRSDALAALREGRESDARESLAAANRLLALAEDTMTMRNLALSEEAGCRIHLAHVSTSGSLDAVRQAKARCVPPSAANRSRVSCEVTPHHLSLTDERLEIVNPPLRGEADREALIDGIADGTVDAIATDHAPHTAEDKASGAPGFSGIEIAFATCNTALVKTGRITLSKLSALMSANPAGLLGLKRGLLVSGFDADLVLVDPDAEFTVDTASLWHSKGKNTPLQGEQLSGKIIATFRRGKVVFDGKRFFS